MSNQENSNPFKVGDKVKFHDPRRNFEGRKAPTPCGRCVVTHASTGQISVRDIMGRDHAWWHYSWFISDDTLTTVEVPTDTLIKILDWVDSQRGRASLTTDRLDVVAAVNELRNIAVPDPDAILRQKVRYLMANPDAPDSQINRILAEVREASKS